MLVLATQLYRARILFCDPPMLVASIDIRFALDLFESRTLCFLSINYLKGAQSRRWRIADAHRSTPGMWRLGESILRLFCLICSLGSRHHFLMVCNRAFLVIISPFRILTSFILLSRMLFGEILAFWRCGSIVNLSLHEIYHFELITGICCLSGGRTSLFLVHFRRSNFWRLRQMMSSSWDESSTLLFAIATLTKWLCVGLHVLVSIF